MTQLVDAAEAGDGTVTIMSVLMYLLRQPSDQFC